MFLTGDVDLLRSVFFVVGGDLLLLLFCLRFLILLFQGLAIFEVEILGFSYSLSSLPP